MILDLTPDNFFEQVHREGPLHVVMHYGVSCTPCKNTMPQYEILAEHFRNENFTNIKFYRFHQWEASYKEFINAHNLKTVGVPTFRYYYMGELLYETARAYTDANELKNVIAEVVDGIETTIGGFPLHDES